MSRLEWNWNFSKTFFRKKTPLYALAQLSNLRIYQNDGHMLMIFVRIGDIYYVPQKSRKGCEDKILEDAKFEMPSLCTEVSVNIFLYESKHPQVIAWKGVQRLSMYPSPVTIDGLDLDVKLFRGHFQILHSTCIVRGCVDTILLKYWQLKFIRSNS